MKVKLQTALFLFSLLLLSTSLLAQVEPVRTLRQGTAFDYRNYGNGSMPDLVAAENSIRSGEWEQAIITYDNIVARQPLWAPAYVRRSMAKSRMGRRTEAAADLTTARRLSVNSVRLFSENNPNARLGLLAHYPDLLDSVSVVDIIAEINALQRSGQFSQAQVRIEKLHDTERIGDPYYALLRGNLELLLNDYDMAIAYYDQGLSKVPDAHLLHNRGLARVLNWNYVDGCTDLLQAADHGHEEAMEQFTDLCNW